MSEGGSIFESAEGANHLHSVLVDESTTASLLHRGVNEFGGDMRGHAIAERADRVRHGDGADLDAVVLRHVGVVNEDAIGNAKAAPRPIRGKGQADLSRQRIGEVVQQERGLVREDAGLFGPEPDRGEVLALGCGEVYDTVDPSANARDSTILQVLDRQLRRVTSFGGLFGRDVPILTDRRLEAAVPVPMPLTLPLTPLPGTPRVN